METQSEEEDLTVTTSSSAVHSASRPASLPKKLHSLSRLKQDLNKLHNIREYIYNISGPRTRAMVVVRYLPLQRATTYL